MFLKDFQCFFPTILRFVLLSFFGTMFSFIASRCHSSSCPLRPPLAAGGPAAPGSAHPKRSPSGVGEGAGLKEERMSIRKASTNTVGSRSIPTPSSPMVSSAHNPNKAEIPDRRKEVNATTVTVILLF